eukprot:gene19396-16639_t
MPTEHGEDAQARGSLDLHIWCHGAINRSAAEFMLVRNDQPGSFLVRESQSSKGDYTLSIYDGKVAHYRINEKPPGNFFIRQKQGFPDIPSLIEHHQAQASGLPMPLNHIIPKAHATAVVVSKKDEENGAAAAGGEAEEAAAAAAAAAAKRKAGEEAAAAKRKAGEAPPLYEDFYPVDGSTGGGGATAGAAGDDGSSTPAAAAQGASGKGKGKAPGTEKVAFGSMANLPNWGPEYTYSEGGTVATKVVDETCCRACTWTGAICDGLFTGGDGAGAAAAQM